VVARQGQAKSRRKTATKSGQWKHWLKPALAFASVAATVAGLGLLVHWMSDPLQWPVRTVQVQGQFRYLQPETVQTEVESYYAAGFFAMEVREIQEHVQHLPWVDQVSVRRVWPDRLEIDVVEQRPVARWKSQSYLNSRAEVFVPDDDEDLSGLVTLDGPDGYQQRMLNMHASLQEQLQPLQLKLTVLMLDARRAWSMRLDNGLEFEIGRKQPVQRVARFVNAYPALMADGQRLPQRVDLRYSNGFAVRWQQAGSAG
jgi:cell division protein FtsQ